MENIDTLWLYLEPYTFISEDAEYFFFYNVNTQKGISFHKSKAINPIVKELQDVENLYSVKMAVEELEDESLYNFVETIQASECGDIIEGELAKPLIMPPTLNLQRSVERLKQHDASISENVLSYLHEVAIYINGECSQNCKGCENEFKQHLCCTRSENTLDLALLKDFLFSISYTGASITLLGGNVFQYAELRELLSILKGINSLHTLITNWRNIPEDTDILSELSHESFRLKVIINNPYQIETIIALAEKIKQNNIAQLWEVGITSLPEYEKAEMLSQHLESLHIDLAIKPLFDGENRAFFEENVFIDQEDLDTAELNRQDIFALQALNTNDFGKITILSDGKVYANLNKGPIGDMEDSIGEMLCKELDSGISWRRTRCKTEPCSQCRFKLICPSPSNYELVIGESNLCHIKLPEKEMK